MNVKVKLNRSFFNYNFKLYNMLLDEYLSRNAHAVLKVSPGLYGARPR